MGSEVQEYIDVAALKSSALRRLHADWQSRRRERSFPARADFDPLEMKYILGNLSLVEVRRHPLRFFYRVHASNIAARTGFDMTGKFLDQNPDVQHRNLIFDHYLRTLDERRPIAARRERTFTDRVMLDCEALALPLARDGANIDMLLTGLVWN
ncbi:MAG: PAS domain-containing protein [Alphaproteobacteria bacterium]|nr:PAS domain-containing protein [Alphaproteobacteria bacterium]